MHLDEVFADPQVIAQESVVKVRHPGHGDVSMLGSALHVDGVPLPVRLPAPDLGAHTAQILGELGFSSEDIARLREHGVV
jgi:crotonobetainyl-CoA:carnitine CoA-transferase CaiB-like acyl-CoA transferase